MNVKQRAEAAGTFRHVNVFLMETLARWVPTTPEMEAKVMMGRHLWLVAQAADRLGKRTRELRAPLNFARAPQERFAEALAQLAALRESGERIEGFYGAALDALARAYAEYTRLTDRVIDEPTVVILEDAMRDIERMRADRARLVQEFPSLAEAGAARSLRAAFEAAPGMVAATDPALQTA